MNRENLKEDLIGIVKQDIATLTNDNDKLGFNNWKWAKKMWRLLNKKPS